jgi:hypothetical protein
MQDLGNPTDRPWRRRARVSGHHVTKSEKVLEVGPITATKETMKTIPLPPVLGGIALLGGVVLLVSSSSRP